MDTRKTVKKKLVLKKSVRNFITRVLITVMYIFSRNDFSEK